LKSNYAIQITAAGPEIIAKEEQINDT